MSNSLYIDDTRREPFYLECFSELLGLVCRDNSTTLTGRLAIRNTATRPSHVRRTRTRSPRAPQRLRTRPGPLGARSRPYISSPEVNA